MSLRSNDQVCLQLWEILIVSLSRTKGNHLTVSVQDSSLVTQHVAGAGVTWPSFHHALGNMT